jgi:hypothetical protein
VRFIAEHPDGDVADLLPAISWTGHHFPDCPPIRRRELPLGILD